MVEVCNLDPMHLKRMREKHEKEIEKKKSGKGRVNSIEVGTCPP